MERTVSELEILRLIETRRDIIRNKVVQESYKVTLD